MSFEWKIFFASFMAGKEKLKNNFKALSIPTDIFKQVASILKDWRAKCHKDINKFDKTHQQHFRELREKVKSYSVMPATSSINTPACTICKHACKSRDSCKSHTRNKHQKRQKPLGPHMLKWWESTLYIYIYIYIYKMVQIVIKWLELKHCKSCKYKVPGSMQYFL